MPVYVAMTRGRQSNHAYIDTDTCHGETDTIDRQRESRSALTIFEQILITQGAELSAQTLQARLTARHFATRNAERHTETQPHRDLRRPR